jgi:nucleoside-diphosphate-sugar epimerase
VRVVVIGGTGHIGSYLTPRLVAAGHDVVVLSRGERRPYRSHPAWGRVSMVQADREAEEAAGTFGDRIAGLAPDAVVDLTCFTPESATALLDAVRGRIGHLLHCGTIWVHGHAVEVPVTEDAPRRPFGAYGEAKAATEELLLSESRRGGVPTTLLHPGHIVGPGWPPIGPAGNLDLDVIGRLARGEEVLLPNAGLETLHHVHADDVAQAFEQALRHRSLALGESFHVTSERAVTLRGFAEAVASWFGTVANLRYAPLQQWEAAGSEHADATVQHVLHSPSVSIDKARRLLSYRPRYTSLEAVAESLDWLIEHGRLDLGGLRPVL